MAKRNLDWLIEQAEEQLEAMLEELKDPEMTSAEKKSVRAVLVQLIGTLQKLYYQNGIEKPDKDSLAELIEKIPSKSAKKVIKNILGRA